ncbi:MAG TPA: MauE/DoxX family redox-associated membrane protein [Gaiellaceae bacterium]|nr:MauE/DoxX family redox-associated membrane protein [Gaiellaceae bacterium]
MAAVVAICVFTLALIFLWSGLAKVVRPEAAAQAIVFFGVARGTNIPLARALATVELAVALSLTAAISNDRSSLLVASLAVAATLFAVFSLLIARSLRRGDRFACSCFGAAAEPLSIVTFARAVVLLALAVAALLTAPSVDFHAGRDELGIDGAAALALLGTVVVLDIGRRMLAYSIVLSHQGAFHDRR